MIMKNKDTNISKDSANGFTSVSKDSLNEALLDAWLRISTSVINSRVVSELSYNESLVCNLLYKIHMDTPEHKLTATDLCNHTKMLKSQMNRTLNQLEQKSIILRERSDSDKRKVYISMNVDKISSYEKQHKQILYLIDHIIQQLGTDKVEEAIDLFCQISKIADDVLK